MARALPTDGILYLEGSFCREAPVTLGEAFKRAGFTKKEIAERLRCAPALVIKLSRFRGTPLTATGGLVLPLRFFADRYGIRLQLLTRLLVEVGRKLPEYHKWEAEDDELFWDYDIGDGD